MATKTTQDDTLYISKIMISIMMISGIILIFVVDTNLSNVLIFGYKISLIDTFINIVGAGCLFFALFVYLRDFTYLFK